MPLLKVLVDGQIHTIPFEPGVSVRDILDATPFRVRSGCHGNGACGLCRVRLLQGNGGAITPNERIHLHENLLERGERLGCQIRPSGDLMVEILNPAPPSNWRATPEGFWQRGVARAHDVSRAAPGVRHPCGVAVDIGTTNISLSLFDLENGRWLGDRWGPNPQAAHGADVVTRLVASAESPEIAQRMSAMVVDALGEALQDFASRDGFDLRRVVCVTLVGNTAMLALLVGKNYPLLLRPQNWTEPIDCSTDDIAPWVARWQIHPHARVDLVQPLAGFVGSDLLAGLIAVRLEEGVAPALFADLGTNSEVALWDGGKLRVTSAAGGPAFESGFRLGMPAEPGAIFRVTRAGEGLRFHVLGGDEPSGICGSGLVDLIARLLETGSLNDRGNLAGGTFQLSVGNPSLVLSKRDVDVFQRAKAGVSTAMAIICADAGVEIKDLQRVCIAGTFGRYLDIASGQAVGLVPMVSPERIELAGNTALGGCADLLLSSFANERLSKLRRDAPELLNLANCPRFEDTFVEQLYLRPFHGGALR